LAFAVCVKCYIAVHALSRDFGNVDRAEVGFLASQYARNPPKLTRDVPQFEVHPRAIV